MAGNQFLTLQGGQSLYGPIRAPIIDLQEARKTQRRPALDMGLIRFGEISMSCVLRKVSEGGAALDIGSQVGIPDQFTLIVLPQKKIYSCNVIWRKDRRIGVQFTGPYHPRIA